MTINPPEGCPCAEIRTFDTPEYVVAFAGADVKAPNNKALAMAANNLFIKNLYPGRQLERSLTIVGLLVPSGSVIGMELEVQVPANVSP